MKKQFLPSKNSNNSSIPPSQDENRPKRNQSLRGNSHRKTGGQKGHRGSTLEMSTTPDQIKELMPGYCNICGNDLGDTVACLLSKRQVVELPPIKPIIIEYQGYARKCTCGHLQKGEYPPQVTNHIQYGPGVEASVAYLSVYQYVPIKRMAEMFDQVFNLPISQGTITNILQRMGRKSQPIYDAIHSKIAQSKVVGGDETGAKVNGDKYWAWVWQNAFLTFITVSVSRGKQTVRQLFPEGFVNAILCSDRWKTHISTYAKGHQLCLAHLLRDLNYLIELEATSWANSMKTLFQKAIKLKHECSEYEPKDPKALEIENKLDQLLARQLDKRKAPKTIVFQDSMQDYRDYLFTFLYNKGVPPDNNASERAIRNFKVKMKVSGQFKNGHQTFAILRSVADTCIKRNIPVYKAMNLIAQINLAGV